MRQLQNETTKPTSLWQRLLAVFNLGGPQWGKPGGSKGNGKDEGSSPEGDDSEQDENDERPNREPGRQPGRKPPAGESPPDLDEIWRDLSGRLGGLLGGGKGTNRPRNVGGGGGGGRRSGSSMSGKGAKKGITLIVVFALLAWLASGFFIVREGEQAVILTFGKSASKAVDPGLSWRFPWPIQTNETISISEVRAVNIGTSVVNPVTGLSNASMLTHDKNILDLRFRVQYRISNLKDYLFNNADQEEAVVFAAESAVREVLGKTPVDVALRQGSCVPQEFYELMQTEANKGSGVASVLNEEAPIIDIAEMFAAEGDPVVVAEEDSEIARTSCPAGFVRVHLRDSVQNLIQVQLNNLKLGIHIFSVNVADSGVQVPDEVRPAFDDARSATAVKESLINEGRQYANQRIASAGGVVSRLMQDAEGYKLSVVAQARGDTQRFLQIYEQYRHAPEVTRNRMYLETMEEIYSNVSKVMMESKSNSLLYLPIDQLLNQEGKTSGAGSSANKGGSTLTETSTTGIDANSTGSVTTTSESPAVLQPARPDLRSRDAFGRNR